LTKYHFWAATDVGLVRDHNEDGFLVSPDRRGTENQKYEGELGSRSWALVADGMGGHAAGEIASSLALECLGSLLPALNRVDEVVSAIEATNLALLNAMFERSELMGMGTTIAGILIDNKHLIAFNVGDSRIYVECNGHFQQISEDHVVGGFMLTKCLGGSATTSVVEPCVTELTTEVGSRILLCSDGLTDELLDPEIRELLLEASPAETLVRAAVQAGGRDNVTAVVIERMQ
jgi:serine/threonine protein phosphatase PrpC